MQRELEAAWNREVHLKWRLEFTPFTWSVAAFGVLLLLLGFLYHSYIVQPVVFLLQAILARLYWVLCMFEHCGYFGRFIQYLGAELLEQLIGRAPVT